MWEHYKLDNPLPEEDTNNKFNDPDYDKEEEKLGSEPSNPDDDTSHRLPPQEHEHFDDPDFDEAWNSDEDSPSESIDENREENDFEIIGDDTLTKENQDTNHYDDSDEWEEV